MTDRWTYILCGCAFVGAMLPLPLPGPNLWPLALLALALTLALRKPWLVCVAMLLATSALAARSEASYRPITEPGTFTGTATLASDPDPNPSGGMHIELDLPSGRYDTWVYGGLKADLRERLAGEKIHITAETRPLSDPSSWHRQRRIVGSLSIQTVADHSPGAWHYRIANTLRRTLDAGTKSLSPTQKALFDGLVFGDDREQSALLTDDFLAGGLTHLLAVSGQNVVFVLLLARPALMRLPHYGRWAGTLVVLLLFATTTRFEPSVVRASTMAGVAASSALFGRKESGRRYLCLAVCALVLVDPQIVHSLGFRLSVLASAGILFWAQPLSERIPGPRPLSLALAVTVAAQLWVSPLLVLTFGSVPVGSLWANLLAVPVAGPLMMWGMTAGALAGVLADLWGGAIAAVLHWPTQIGTNWLTWVAAGASRFWLGSLRMWHVLALGACVIVMLLAKQKSGASLAFGSLALVVLAVPSFSLAAAGPAVIDIGQDSRLWRGEQANVLVLGAGTSDRLLLSDLRESGISQLNLLVSEVSTNRLKPKLAALRQRYGDFEAWLRNGQVSGSARMLSVGTAVLGDVAVHILSVRPDLEVEVELLRGRM